MGVGAGLYMCDVVVKSSRSLSDEIANVNFLRQHRTWWVLVCNGYNELAFLCNETARYEIRAKTSIAVLYWILIEEFWKLAIKGVILHQTRQSAFLGCFDGFRCQGLRFYSSHCKRCISYSNSACLSVWLSVTRRYCVKTTARSTVQFAPLDSKMCLVLWCCVYRNCYKIVLTLFCRCLSFNNSSDSFLW